MISQSSPSSRSSCSQSSLPSCSQSSSPSCSPSPSYLSLPSRSPSPSHLPLPSHSSRLPSPACPLSPACPPSPARPPSSSLSATTNGIVKPPGSRVKNVRKELELSNELYKGYRVNIYIFIIFRIIIKLVLLINNFFIL